MGAHTLGSIFSVAYDRKADVREVRTDLVRSSCHWRYLVVEIKVMVEVKVVVEVAADK